MAYFQEKIIQNFVKYIKAITMNYKERFSPIVSVIWVVYAVN